MKAMILAAGFGERLLPVTKTLPKPLIPLLNYPVLFWNLNMLANEGISEVVSNTHHLGDKVIETVKKSSFKGMKIHFSAEEKILGTGGGVKKARKFFNDDTFIVMNSDILLDIDFKKALSFHRDEKAAATMVLRDDPKVNKLGGLYLEGDNVSGFTSQITLSNKTPLLFTGVHILEPEIFNFISNDESFSIIDGLYYNLLAGKKEVKGFLEDGYFSDIGTFDDYLKVTFDGLEGWLSERLAALNPQLINLGSDTKKVDTTLIDSSAEISDKASIGARVVIGKNAVIGENVSLEDCVVFPSSKVPDNFQGFRAIITEDGVIEL